MKKTYETEISDFIRHSFHLLASDDFSWIMYMYLVKLFFLHKKWTRCMYRLVHGCMLYKSYGPKNLKFYVFESNKKLKKEIVNFIVLLHIKFRTFLYRSSSPAISLPRCSIITAWDKWKWKKNYLKSFSRLLFSI